MIFLRSSFFLQVEIDLYCIGPICKLAQTPPKNSSGIVIFSSNSYLVWHFETLVNHEYPALKLNFFYTVDFGLENHPQLYRNVPGTSVK